MGELKSTMAEKVMMAVNTTTQNMQRTLIEQITSTLEQSTQKLEAKVTRSKERQYSAIRVLRDKQDKFHEDIRSSLSSLKIIETVQG